MEIIWNYEKCKKIEVLGRDRTKNLLPQAISEKIFGIKWSNPVKVDRKKKFGMSFCVFLTVTGKV